MVKIRVKDASRCCQPAGTVIEVSADRAKRWVERGYAAPVGGAASAASSTKDDGKGAPEKLPTKKADLVALYAAEIGKDPAEDLTKVTVKTLTEAIEAHRAAASE